MVGQRQRKLHKKGFAGREIFLQKEKKNAERQRTKGNKFYKEEEGENRNREKGGLRGGRRIENKRKKEKRSMRRKKARKERGRQVL